MLSNIRILDAAKKFIARQGQVISVKVEKDLFLGCSGPRSRPCPNVWLGLPEVAMASEFKSSDLDGITVYVHRTVQILDRSVLLEIGVDGVGDHQKLIVYSMPNERPVQGK